MNKIDELLNRGVVNIIPDKDSLKKELESGKKLRIYQGFDPTSPELHIGHMIGLRKLRQWQELGHEVIFLIGDFTGMIGDPTGKDKTRSVLTREQVLKNAETYKNQAGKILNFTGKNAVKIKYNSEWLAKLSVVELVQLTSYLTIQQIIERDMFQKRLENNMDIAMNEFLYPFMQGYDSIAMDIDVEVGGNDQLFNMMTGRDLMHKIKRKNKFVMTTPLLTDSEGKKIGKSEGNAIAFTDTPRNLFGKIMSLGDDVILQGLEYLTDIPLSEIEIIKDRLASGENPIEYKKLLALEVTKQLNSEEEAQDAQSYFEKTIQQKQIPTTMEIIKLTSGEQRTILDFMAENNLVSSKAEGKRLIEQKGVSFDKQLVHSPHEIIREGVLQIGKRTFVKVEIST